MEALASDKNPIRNEIIFLLNGGNAHVSLDEALKDLSLPVAGVKHKNVPYTIWQLVEHIRITQWDIVEFSKGPAHKSPQWPDEYWPNVLKPDNQSQWDNSLAQIRSDRKAFIDLTTDPSTDLYTTFPHGTGQNLLREALLIADHNSYHIGQIILIRRLLGEWSNS